MKRFQLPDFCNKILDIVWRRHTYYSVMIIKRLATIRECNGKNVGLLWARN